MIHTTSAALFFLAAGIFTSVSILSGYQVLFAIPLVFFSWKAWKDKKLDLPLSAWILIGFALIATASLLMNIELVPKPSKNFGRIKYYLFGFAGIYVFKYWLQESTDTMKRNLTRVFFVSLIVAGLYACWEYFVLKEPRVKSLTETMRYGYGSGMVLLSLLSALLHREKIRSWFDWKLAVPALLIGFLGMYLTFTRGALLGFICGLPFVIYFFRAKLGLIFAGLAGAAVLTLVGFYLFGTGTHDSRFLSNKNLNSDVVRRSQWDAAVIAIKERPFFGYGLSNFHSQLKRIKHQYDLPKKEYDDAHAHNLFLEVGAGTGLIGLFVFISWIFVWAYESFRGDKVARALVIPFGVAFVVSSQFEVTFDANNASMIFFLYACSSAINQRSKVSA